MSVPPESSPKPLPKRPPLPCGHPQYGDPNRHYPTRVLFQHLKIDVGLRDRIDFVSLVAGDRKLVATTCEEPQCILIDYYLETISTGAVAKLGDDREVVTAALSALLNDPGAQVVTLVVHTRGRISVLLPRHHMPTFVVGELNPSTGGAM